MTATLLSYSEQRQKVLFKAARELRKIASQVLLDTVAPGSVVSRPNAQWAITVARNTALQANDLETKGHEVTTCTNLDDTLNGKSKDAYSAAIDKFEAVCATQFDADWHSIKQQALGW